MKKETYKENIPCCVTDCDSLQKNDDLWMYGNLYYCDEHYREIEEQENEMKLNAMIDIGIPQEEAEAILYDY